MDESGLHWRVATATVCGILCLMTAHGKPDGSGWFPALAASPPLPLGEEDLSESKGEPLWVNHLNSSFQHPAFPIHNALHPAHIGVIFAPQLVQNLVPGLTTVPHNRHAFGAGRCSVSFNVSTGVS